MANRRHIPFWTRAGLVLPIVYALFSMAALFVDPIDPSHRLGGIVSTLSLPLGYIGVFFSEATGEMLDVGAHVCAVFGVVQYAILGYLIDLVRMTPRRTKPRRKRSESQCHQCGRPLIGLHPERCTACGARSPGAAREETLRAAAALQRHVDDHE